MNITRLPQNVPENEMVFPWPGWSTVATSSTGMIRRPPPCLPAPYLGTIATIAPAGYKHIPLAAYPCDSVEVTTMLLGGELPKIRATRSQVSENWVCRKLGCREHLFPASR